MQVFSGFSSQPEIAAAFLRRRLALAVFASVVGIIACWVTSTPFGLLAPVAALFLYFRDRSVRLVSAVLAIGLAASVAAIFLTSDDMRLQAISWATFFALALCIGGSVATAVTTSAFAEAKGLPARSADRDKMWAARPSGIDLIHPDDRKAAAHAAARAFWTNVPQIISFRRLQSDGGYRWTETRTDPEYRAGVNIPELIGERNESSPVTSEAPVGRGEEAVQAAKIVEDLFGNGWALDAAGAWIYLPPFAQTTLGKTIEDLNASLGEGDIPWKDLLHPDEYEEVAANWLQCLATGAPFNAEFRIRRKTGYAWARSAARVVRDSEGRISGWYGNSIDIDVYRKTLDALRERERELSQLVDMVPSHLWRLTPAGEPIFFNKRMVDFLGMDVADADRPGMTRMAAMIEAAIHADDRASFENVLALSLDTGNPFALRYRMRRADGMYRWMSSRAEPLRDPGGKIVQWYGLCHDIEDQIHAEDALRESERLLRQLVETLPAMIDCAAPDGEPIYRSQQLRDFLGYNLEALDGSGQSRLYGTLSGGVHPDDLNGVTEQYAHSLATGEPYARRHRLRRRDGEYRWVETRAAAMRDAEGQIVQWNVICLDIDAEVRAQEELLLAQDSLARASQAASLAELSASIAHEVNQPLAAIVANSHAGQRWLAADPPNIERAQKVVQRITRDANVAADVVSRIRALFRQSAEKREVTTLGSLIAEAHDLLADDAKRRSIRLDVRIDPDTPPVEIDRVQVQQVLINLMRNGMEAMETVPGERAMAICVRPTNDGTVQIEVGDRGAGVADPERIFEPFFTTKGNGMGMGLAISRSIIEAHGGRLWAEENEPQGAKFIFALPVESKVSE